MFKTAVVNKSMVFEPLKFYSIMVCLHIQGGNPHALANCLSPVQAENPWYNYFISPSIV